MLESVACEIYFDKPSWLGKPSAGPQTKELPLLTEASGQLFPQMAEYRLKPSSGHRAHTISWDYNQRKKVSKVGSVGGWEMQGQTLPQGEASCCFYERTKKGGCVGKYRNSGGSGHGSRLSENPQLRAYLPAYAQFPQFQQVGNHTYPGNSETSGCFWFIWHYLLCLRKPHVVWGVIGSVS